MVKKIGMIFGLFVATSPLHAAPETQLAKQANAGNKAIVEKNMVLTPEQAKLFWPLYDEYQIQLNRLADENDAVIAKFTINYNDLKDDLATELLGRAMKLEQKRLDLKTQWIDRFGKELPAKVVARFYQIQSKIEAADRYEVMQKVPLIKTP